MSAIGSLAGGAAQGISQNRQHLIQQAQLNLQNRQLTQQGEQFQQRFGLEQAAGVRSQSRETRQQETFTQGRLPFTEGRNKALAKEFDIDPKLTEGLGRNEAIQIIDMVRSIATQAGVGGAGLINARTKKINAILDPLKTAKKAIERIMSDIDKSFADVFQQLKPDVLSRITGVSLEDLERARVTPRERVLRKRILELTLVGIERMIFKVTQRGLVEGTAGLQGIDVTKLGGSALPPGGGRRQRGSSAAPAADGATPPPFITPEVLKLLGELPDPEG